MSLGLYPLCITMGLLSVVRCEMFTAGSAAVTVDMQIRGPVRMNH